MNTRGEMLCSSSEYADMLFFVDSKLNGSRKFACCVLQWITCSSAIQKSTNTTAFSSDTELNFQSFHDLLCYEIPWQQSTY